MYERKNPAACFIQAEFFYESFSFICLCSFSSSDTTATSSTEAETRLAYAANLSSGTELRGIFIALPYPGSSIKNNIACV